jgi:transcriptional regulator with XRE-family HTH domain
MEAERRKGEGVEALKITREALGWKPYRMAKELGISQSQYTYLEETGRTLGTPVLVAWIDLCSRELKWSADKCVKLLKVDASKRKGKGGKE